jgi:drug/metabolite transporter (DMT)-like permease
VLLAVICALLSALGYALASVLQHRAARAQGPEQSMRLGLLGRLVRNPWWLLGMACDGAAFAFQFVALGHGSLVLVQPLLVSGLLFALPLGAWLEGTAMTNRDWLGAALVVAGLSAFLLASSPDPGHPGMSGQAWAMLLGFTSVGIAGLILLAQRGTPRARAFLLAAAAGINYGVTAALTKVCAHQLGSGPVRLLTHWEAYALVVFGLLGMLLAQSAFQAGSLDASLPMLTVVDPVVSIAIGAFALGEGLEIGLLPTFLEVTGLVAMSVGVFLLARAEAVAAQAPQGVDAP